MKITITESQSQRVRNPDPSTIGYITIKEPTGREWEIDIPIEPVKLREVWAGWQDDVSRLLMQLRDILSDAAINFRGRN